jgi:hypothetical protein
MASAFPLRCHYQAVFGLWLTSGNFFDNEGFGGLPCPKMGKSYFNG